MLQQTQVKTVIPYFNNFVKKISSLKALSNSNEKTVLKLWEGLGYYTRAKNLYKTSKILIKKSFFRNYIVVFFSINSLINITKYKGDNEKK